MSSFEELIQAVDRDHCPGSRAMISLRGQEDATFRRALRAARTAEWELSRRGVYHGEYAECDAKLAGIAAERCQVSLQAWRARWEQDQPIVLPAILAAALTHEAHELSRAHEWFMELSEPGALRRLVERQCPLTQSPWRVSARAQACTDAERDLERIAVEHSAARARQALWLKSSWLSTHPDDASLRVRVSYGTEVDDDHAPDLALNREVGRLAASVLPGARMLRECASLSECIEALIGEPLLFTQDIAYWNAPEGGALFHHDAFAEDGSLGQLGVCYAQLSGETMWLALSTSALALRIQEFVEALAQGELPWVRAQLWPNAQAWRELTELIEDPDRLVRELSLPGQGRLGALVNRGPEFSSFLADAGHAWLLRAGDVILLPNHGLESTCMHSVFCASDAPTYALSLAIRSNRA